MVRSASVLALTGLINGVLGSRCKPWSSAHISDYTASTSSAVYSQVTPSVSSVLPTVSMTESASATLSSESSSSESISSASATDSTESTATPTTSESPSESTTNITTPTPVSSVTTSSTEESIAPTSTTPPGPITTSLTAIGGPIPDLPIRAGGLAGHVLIAGDYPGIPTGSVHFEADTGHVRVDGPGGSSVYLCHTAGDSSTDPLMVQQCSDPSRYLACERSSSGDLLSCSAPVCYWGPMDEYTCPPGLQYSNWYLRRWNDAGTAFGVALGPNVQGTAGGVKLLIGTN
ncbi:hypothetical protein Micbo1qcDRAFT_210726 [Microdochium bolleyi]|uniref:Ricin B lectin domain-containing protein n=1 Tax=Microdochium bolleyi TaxID=196109 RepID=A0A136JH25_9PEZI|nr:hypothetical protein Micbo1qcDRAFT_210726 [Microdochium bolleyi]